MIGGPTVGATLGNAVGSDAGCQGGGARSKEVAAGDFGALPINQDLGFEKLGKQDDSDQLEARLYGAYDVLVPAYARGDTKLDAAGLIAAATCRQVFPKYAGTLLLPYYEYLARDFFTWLNKASK